MVSNIPYTDRDLITRIAAGEEPAFRLLFDRYSKRLYSFALALTKSAPDAEEIIQESFARIWILRHTLTGIEQPQAWLFRVVRNRTLDHLRKISREQKMIHQVWQQLSAVDRSLEELILTREYQQLIDQALAQVSPQKQEVYHLSRVKEYSHEEIAAITGLSKSRVNNILSETLRFIKSFLDQHSGDLGMIFWIYAWDHFR